MHPLLRGFLDLLYPPRCEACGRLRRQPLCPDCLDSVQRIAPPICETCGAPFDPLAHGGPRCPDCRRARRPYSRARTAAYYQGPLADAIRRFKYHGQVVLAPPLGRIMLEALAGPARDLDPSTIDAVCPVPLHQHRLRERGFNQSQLLAEEIAAGIGKPLERLLDRTRPTAPQVDLPAESRAANVAGAFAPRLAEVIQGKRVLLIDDLFTTGATLTECARTLRRAEAAEVRVLTLARPLPLWRRPAADASLARPA